MTTYINDLDSYVDEIGCSNNDLKLSTSKMTKFLSKELKDDVNLWRQLFYAKKEEQIDKLESIVLDFNKELLAIEPDLNNVIVLKNHNLRIEKYSNESSNLTFGTIDSAWNLVYKNFIGDYPLDKYYFNS